MLRDYLLSIFQTWFAAAASDSDVFLGEVVQLSEDLILFPDCTTGASGTLYSSGHYVARIQVALAVDVSAVVESLLAKPPGTFSAVAPCPPHTSWKEIDKTSAEDTLWYALSDWFLTFAGSVDFEFNQRDDLHSHIGSGPHLFYYLSSLKGPIKVALRTKFS